MGYIWFKIGMWALLKLFPHILLYSPGPDGEDNDVKAMVFTVDEQTLNLFSTRKEMNSPEIDS